MTDSSNYIMQAIRTEAPVTAEVEKRLIECARLIHGVFGVTGELGEFVDPIKKYIFYGKKFDRINLLEELGDKFWYIALLMHELGLVEMTPVLEANIAKLRTRYPERFTEYDALNRNLNDEREVLERSTTLSEDFIKDENEKLEARREDLEERILRPAIKKILTKLGVEPKQFDIIWNDMSTEDIKQIIRENAATLPKSDWQELPERIVFLNADAFEKPIDPNGTYYVLRIDGDTDDSHFSRQCLKKWCREAYYEEEPYKGMQQRMMALIQVIEDDIRTKSGPQKRSDT